MTADAPLFSVIVAVYRHWDLVPGLMDALAAQDLPGRFEIILVDNAPDEARPAIALPATARIVTCPTPGSYAARNAGSREAAGRLLAFTDADCRPEPGWLAAMAAAAGRAGPEMLLAGPVALFGSPRPNRYELYEMIRGIPQARYVRNGYAATANLVVPTAVFQALGGFDSRRFSGGDAEFCWRAGAAGHPVRLVPDAVVRHPARSRWDELVAKTRRVTGGQVGAGSPGRRLVWFLRALTPPLRAFWRFARTAAPARHRLAAIRVLFALWLVELDEALRITFARKAPERR
jgi:GT2 family glycosyltransferase